MLTASAKRNGLTDVFWLTTILLIFYSIWLGSYPLFTPDEGRYSAVAREMLFTHDYITPRLNGVPFLDKPILYYWLQAAAMKLFGVNEWALRFFPMLLGVLTCITAYGCARVCFNRRTGILSTLILGTSPLFFSGAHYANMDLEVAAFISMTLMFFMMGVQTKNSLLFFAAYLCSALAFLTKGMIGIAFPALITGGWIICLWRWDYLKKVYLPQGLLLFFCVVTPWYVLEQRVIPDFFHFFFVTQQVTRFLSQADFNSKSPIWFYVPIVLLGFFPWSIFLVQSIRKAFIDRRQNQMLLFILLWFAVIFVFFSIPHSKTIGYILPTLPPLALLCGYYLDGSWNAVVKKNIVVAQQVFIVSCFIFTIALFLLLRKPMRFDIASDFTAYINIAATILLLAAIVASITIRHTKASSLFNICISTSLIFLLTIVSGANELNRSTAKPLLQILNQVKKPGDEIVNYFKFYQDIPVYLGQRITLVADWNSPNIPNRDNWVRELWFGTLMQKNHDSLIDENTFWQRWHSDKKLFVFLNQNYFEQFTEHTKKYYEVGRYNNIILVSNKP